MSLSHRQERLLRRADRAPCRSDPDLASMLSIFARVTADEKMPAREQLRPQLTWPWRVLLWPVAGAAGGTGAPGMRSRSEEAERMAMAETAQFTIGAEARCSDGVCGEVSRVVVDPVARTVTHLVVEPKHRQGLGRLVSLDLIEATTGEVRLRCTIAEFGQLDLAEETQFLPGSSGYAQYGPGHASSWPYYGLGGTGMTGGMGIGLADVSPTVTCDRVPVGEVAVRRGEPVHATDGDIGHVQGLVIDPRNHHVTHVLLQEGHLWGRKDVAIPIGAVAGADDGIQLTITKQEVQDLPPVDIDHPDGDICRRAGHR